MSPLGVPSRDWNNGQPACQGWTEEHWAPCHGVIPMDFRDVLGIKTSVTRQCPLMLSSGPSGAWPGELSKCGTPNPSMTQHWPWPQWDSHLHPIRWSPKRPGPPPPTGCYTVPLVDDLLRLLLDVTSSPDRVPCSI